MQILIQLVGFTSWDGVTDSAFLTSFHTDAASPHLEHQGHRTMVLKLRHALQSLRWFVKIQMPGFSLQVSD